MRRLMIPLLLLVTAGCLGGGLDPDEVRPVNWSMEVEQVELFPCRDAQVVEVDWGDPRYTYAMCHLSVPTDYVSWVPLGKSRVVGLTRNGLLETTFWNYWEERYDSARIFDNLAFDEMSYQDLVTYVHEISGCLEEEYINIYWAMAAWRRGDTSFASVYGGRWWQDVVWKDSSGDGGWYHKALYRVPVPIQAVWRQPDGGFFVLSTQGRLWWGHRTWEMADGVLYLDRVPVGGRVMGAQVRFNVPVLYLDDGSVVVATSYSPRRRLVVYKIHPPRGSRALMVARPAFRVGFDPGSSEELMKASESLVMGFVLDDGVCMATWDPPFGDEAGTLTSVKFDPGEEVVDVSMSYGGLRWCITQADGDVWCMYDDWFWDSISLVFVGRSAGMPLGGRCVVEDGE